MEYSCMLSRHNKRVALNDSAYDDLLILETGYGENNRQIIIYTQNCVASLKFT